MPNVIQLFAPQPTIEVSVAERLSQLARQINELAPELARLDAPLACRAEALEALRDAAYALHRTIEAVQDSYRSN